MRISSLLIGMFVAVGVIISLYMFAENLGSAQHYNVQINSSYKSTYDKIDDLQEVTNRTQEKIREIAEKEDKSFFTGIWDGFVVTKEIVWGTVSGTATAASISTGLIGSFFQDLGLASENNHIMAIAISILGILLIAAAIYILIEKRW